MLYSMSMGEIPIIIAIRPWEMDDAPDLAGIINNERIQANLRDGLPFPYAVEDARAFLSTMLNSPKDKTYAFAITADDRVVGSIGVFRKDNIHFRTAEMGYFIAQSCWGQGICTDAVIKTCRFIFGFTDIIRIFAEPFAYNTASCRVLEKAGFLCEGTLRKNAVKNGKIIDMKLYALVKED
jgi:RimJ/RimL family protein N-acetyltransferase